MDSFDRNRKHSFYRSVCFAFRGIYTGVKSERNMRIHITAAILASLASFIFKLTLLEWILVLFAIGGTISLELLNSALERVVDLASPRYHNLAKEAKDLAAGAVLVFAIISLLIGLLIFVPKLVQLF
ncbi:diacylglycerol kinase family protein [Peribacillus kribbensis]|uniref:diacylglycerol kinase family protein n=1 Tax=Peribacillus kribbensis TaxID=356658 RepID=UPI00047CE812|nr:diacylglycerol kinase family protein [Peribacillus kribbensis]